MTFFGITKMGIEFGGCWSYLSRVLGDWQGNVGEWLLRSGGRNE